MNISNSNHRHITTKTDRLVLLRPLAIIASIVERRHKISALANDLAGVGKSKKTFSTVTSCADNIEGSCSESTSCLVSEDSGDEDSGDGDPDSDRPPSSLNLPSSAASPHRLFRTTAPRCRTSSQHNLKFTKRKTVQNLPKSLADFMNMRRAHWMAFSLTVIAFLLAVYFSIVDKDGLAALCLTEPICIVLAAFLRIDRRR